MYVAKTVKNTPYNYLIQRADDNILLSWVPAKLTYLFQPLDLSVNPLAKNLMKNRFSKLCDDQVRKQLDEGNV